jgi:hypothetical protein
MARYVTGPRPGGRPGGDGAGDVERHRVISGIRPASAQTIVHLGVDLGNVVTKATLADAFAVALRKIGMSVTRGA